MDIKYPDGEVLRIPVIHKSLISNPKNDDNENGTSLEKILQIAEHHWKGKKNLPFISGCLKFNNFSIHTCITESRKQLDKAIKMTKSSDESVQLIRLKTIRDHLINEMDKNKEIGRLVEDLKKQIGALEEPSLSKL